MWGQSDLILSQKLEVSRIVKSDRLVVGINFDSPEQRLTRLQIVQTALKLCSKIMPNFGKRRFRYFEEGYLNKWINIAAFNRVKNAAFSALWGPDSSSNHHK